ncbi:MAG TPA: DAK2 domain-containing protein, partial [Nitriliruptorales bacterium]|nr:DAK2 domain-containing protein [Nitriliruptorales bacterium]
QQRGELGAPDLCAALRRARALAYAAVADPVEGTMLTAIRAAAEGADGARPGTAPDLTRRVLDAVHRAVVGTTQQLEALRVAGVVDAGARGFEVFCQVLHGLVSGEATEDAARFPPPHVDRRGRAVDVREGGSLEYRFEVQYVLAAPEDDAPLLRQRLERLGDSVVVVGSGELLNVHVHTNQVGAAIEEGLLLGRPSRIQVTYLAEQIAERERTRRVDGDADRTPTVGCVTVLPGDGLSALAQAHGATVVTGRAGDLPSVADLLNAVGAVRTERVVLLPGHRNVVPTARQAARVSEEELGRRVDVVEPADSPPAVLAALSVLDATAPDADAAVAAMADAASGVTAGEVVAAVRPADTPIGVVRRGQYLAVAAGEVVAASDDPLEALHRAAEACGVADAEIVVLLVGAGVDEAERERAAALLADLTREAELEVLDAGQRPARYLLGVE